YMVRIKNPDGSLEEFGQVIESYTDENDPNIAHIKVKTDEGEYWTTVDKTTGEIGEGTITVNADTSAAQASTVTLFDRIDAGLRAFQSKMDSMGFGGFTSGLVNAFIAVNGAIGATIGYVSDLWDYFKRLQQG